MTFGDDDLRAMEGAALPKRTADGLPIIPPLLPNTPAPADGAVAVCGECGLRIMRVMGYVCPNVRCPTGLGGAKW